MIRRIFSTILITTLSIVPLASDSFAQELSREVREKFESMVRELDGTLQAKFQRAIDNGTSVVELTPKEFQLFRDNPVNPFDIGDVDPNDLDGNIELRFELPSLRNRPVKPFERQSRNLRRNLRTAVAKISQSVARVTDGRDQISLATIVDSDGLLITKSSELKDHDSIYCDIPNRGNYEARIVKINQENDIALLRVDAKGLTPVTWSNRQPLNGSFVVTPDQKGQVVSIGSYSVVARTTVGDNRGFLGVAPRTVSSGVQIGEQIEPDTAAFAAGLQVGDIITAIDGFVVRESVQLTNAIRKRRPGDKIRIEFIRNGQSRVTNAKLASRNLSGERAARFKMMSRLGAIPSERDTDFPVVFQHDSPLFPEQCGGPICDLYGNVLGVNIARETRASTFAIPSAHMKTIVEEWVRFELASRDKRSR